jgi:prepilin signal peptidase PulO-like enzyme (type II secretory pathway)
MSFLVIVILSQAVAAVVVYLSNYFLDRRISQSENGDIEILGEDNKVEGQFVIVIHFIFALIFAYIAENKFGEWHIYQLFIIVSYLILVSIIDLRSRLILHSVSLIGAIVFGIIGNLQHGFVETVIGGLAGFTGGYLIYLIAAISNKWIMTRKNMDASEIPFGFGDVTLLGVIGLLLGWPGVIAGIFLGIFSAGIFSAGLILWKWLRGNYEAFSTIPLGPFLAFGAIISIVLAART